jgi:hypothetical protein
MNMPINTQRPGFWEMLLAGLLMALAALAV